MDQGVPGAKLGRDRRQNDRLHDFGPQLLVENARVVLSRDHDVGHPLGDAALVLDCDLGLAVGAQVRQLAALANLGQTARQAMGQGDRQGHQLGGFAAGEADHHPLVAGAQFVVALIHAHGDIRRLLLDADEGAAGFVVEAVVGVGIADLFDRLADHGLEVHVRRGRDLTQDQHDAGGRRRLARHAGVGVLAQDCVQDRVRDLVAHLVRVPLGHRLGREQVLRIVKEARHRSPGLALGQRASRPSDAGQPEA